MTVSTDSHAISVESRPGPINPKVGVTYRWRCTCGDTGRHWRHLEANARSSGRLHVQHVTQDGPCHRCGQDVIAVWAGTSKVTHVTAEPDGGWWVAVDQDGEPTGEPAEVGGRVAWMPPDGGPDVPRHGRHDCRHTPSYKRLMEHR